MSWENAWVFDLDGTLTAPMHDFAALKRSLGLPAELDVLAGIATRPASEQGGLHAAVRAWEAEHVDRAEPAEGAEALLHALRGRPLGILTRNTRASALRTLARIGLGQHFVQRFVIGRDDATPKPSPAGLRWLLGAWRVPPSAAVMVGDYRDDLLAGRAAGARTVWVDHGGDGRFAEHADLTVPSLSALLERC